MTVKYKDEMDDFLTNDKVEFIGKIVDVQNTDFSGLGNKIVGAVKEIYPINGVPQDVVESLSEIVSALELADKGIDALIETVQSEVE